MRADSVFEENIVGVGFDGKTIASNLAAIEKLNNHEYEMTAGGFLYLASLATAA
jgi:hypothetical protein